MGSLVAHPQEDGSAHRLHWGRLKETGRVVEVVDSCTQVVIVLGGSSIAQAEAQVGCKQEVCSELLDASDYLQVDSRQQIRQDNAYIKTLSDAEIAQLNLRFMRWLV